MTPPPFRRILLAIDSSPAARAATEVIGHIAAPAQLEVVVLHVWNMQTRIRGGRWDIETATEARLLVDEVVADLKAAGVKASGEIVNAADEKVGLAIERAATELGADLVAVGSRGLSDLAGAFKGSISHRLIADVDCPVLVSPAGPARTQSIRRILVAVSHQSESGPLTDLAVAISKSVGGTIHVLHVLAPPRIAGEYTFLEPIEEAQATVDGAVERIRAAGAKVSGEVKFGNLSVAHEIVEVARIWDADLIIAGSRHHKDLAALIVGATEHDLIREAGRPILIAARPTE